MLEKGGLRTAFFVGAARRGFTSGSITAIACLLLSCAASAQDGKRDAAAQATFMRQVPCPATRKTGGPCPGYVVEHIRSVCSGGSSSAGNLQWKKLDETARPEQPPCQREQSVN